MDCISTLRQTPCLYKALLDLTIGTTLRELMYRMFSKSQELYASRVELGLTKQSKPNKKKHSLALKQTSPQPLCVRPQLRESERLFHAGGDARSLERSPCDADPNRKLHSTHGAQLRQMHTHHEVRIP